MLDAGELVTSGIFIHVHWRVKSMVVRLENLFKLKLELFWDFERLRHSRRLNCIIVSKSVLLLDICIPDKLKLGPKL